MFWPDLRLKIKFFKYLIFLRRERLSLQIVDHYYCEGLSMNVLSFLPQDQVFWYVHNQNSKHLNHDITTDVVIIGGGMAGLSAAQSFRQKGCQVVLLEKNYCGSGATGKSSGFITPDSELPLRKLIQSLGPIEAKKLWDFINSGVQHIRYNIQNYNLNCDYQEQDTLVLANTHRTFTSEIEREYHARQNLGYTSTLLVHDQIESVIGSHDYAGGITYSGTFGIQPYTYCLGMKNALQEMGVAIYEETPVITLQDHAVQTHHARIQAEHIIVCTDHYAGELKSLIDKVYHVQTFLMLSAPLSQQQIKKIFPEHQYMAWDTDLVYHYYRLTGDNRLMLGGAGVFDTFAHREKHDNNRVAKKLARYFDTKFPGLNLQFEYMWPGLIGISKDLLPIVGPDRTMSSVYYVTAATGLPWAAALGVYSAEHLIDKKSSFDALFSPYRHFTFGPVTQKILGKPITFAVSDFLTIGSL